MIFVYGLKGEIYMKYDDFKDYIDGEGVVLDDEEILEELEDLDQIEEKYSKDYDEEKFINKVLKNIKHIGEEFLYNLLIGYYLLQDDRVPIKVKATIIGALGYFIAPLDLIPDFVIAVGYADDAAAIAGAIAVAAFYVTPEIKEKARHKLNELLH